MSNNAIMQKLSSNLLAYQYNNTAIQQYISTSQSQYPTLPSYHSHNGIVHP